MQKPPHIAVVPIPAMGHIIPLTEFVTQLELKHGVSATFIIPHYGSPSFVLKPFLQALPEKANVVHLPPVSFDDLPATTELEARLAIAMTRCLPGLRDSLKALAESTHLVTLVVDVFGTDAFDVATELGLSKYVFFSQAAFALSFLHYLPQLDESCDCEYRDLPDPVQIPGSVSVHGQDLSDVVSNRKSEAYKWTLHHVKRYKLSDGILVNSFLDLEPGAFEATMDSSSSGGGGGTAPIYPIGPIIRPGKSGASTGSECLEWLDKQPQGSVVYISFGSGGQLSHEQMTELALGLEMSQQKFIWVLCNPYHKLSDEFDFLPDGFLDRTRGSGLLVQSWAPQAEILAHGSVGGFVSHCGWNSILESVVNGVPIITWPLYCEQKMNAIFLADQLKIALQVKKNEKGMVDREEIATSIKRLMVGDEGRPIISKMRDLKRAAALTLSQDGSSSQALAKLVEIWKK